VPLDRFRYFDAEYVQDGGHDVDGVVYRRSSQEQQTFGTPQAAMRACAIQTRSSMAWSRGSWAMSVVQTTASDPNSGMSASARRSRAAGGTSPGRPSSSALIQQPRLVRPAGVAHFLVRVSAAGDSPGSEAAGGPSVVTGNRTPGHRQPVELPPPVAQIPGVACPAGAEIAKVE
jgi:hypothetical protein